MDKTIKLTKETYNMLNRYVGILRMRERKPVSMSYAVSKLLKNIRKSDITSFAGAWSMSDVEAEKIKKDLKKTWKSWKK